MRAGQPAAEVARAFEALGRAIKRIANYRHQRDKHAEYLALAYSELHELIVRQGALTVEVEPAALLFDGEPVLTEPARDGSMCFRLHRDGVRRLTFLPGLTVEELLAFTRIALPEIQDDHGPPTREDALIELWKADLSHVAYEAVAAFEVAQTEADELAVEAAALLARETLRAAAEKLGPGPEEALLAKRPIVGASDLEAIDPPEGPRRLQRAAFLVLRVVERRVAGRDLDSLRESLGRIIDEMLRLGDAPGLLATLDRLGALGDEAVTEIRVPLGKRLSALPRLTRFAALCDASIDLFVFGLPAYLKMLPFDVGPTLLEAMAAIEAKGIRAAFASAMAVRIEGCRALYEEALRTAPAPISQALLSAIDGLDFGLRGFLAALALQHADPSVQLEALQKLAASDPQTALAQLGPFLVHREPDVRIAAAQALGRLPMEEAASLLLGRMRALEFGLAERVEREAFHVALGGQKTAVGFGFLSERLTHSPRAGLLKSRHSEEQLLAIRGLAADGSARALRLLEYAADVHQGNPAVVASAARAAANHVRELLQRVLVGGE